MPTAPPGSHAFTTRVPITTVVRSPRVAIAAVAVGAAAVLPIFSPAPAHARPETAGLDPVLATAYSRAAAAAHAEGVPLSITSGRRTRAEQKQLWRNGLATYGSPGAARRWVLPPNESTHVTGDAIDVGPRAGATWLEVNGFRWGLCRTFDNEWWHFEVATVPGMRCPPMWADAAARQRGNF
nr:M15 family metallopeptidase [Gordonia rhizosphera]